MDKMDNINPLQLFKEELETDDLSLRINTVHKLPIVATLLSPDTIRNSLLPYLEGLIKKEEDEVVFAITEEFANLPPFLGAQHTLVLPYLESLCAHDQTVVRDRAVKSITKLCQKYSDNEISNFIIPLIIRLASNQANFTYRVSATHLMCNVYPRAGMHKEKLRQKFIDISNEQMLLLQRVTATKIPHMCRVYEKEFVLSDLIGILKHRSTDEQDQIRVLATESFKEVSSILTRDENKTFIMPLIIQAAEDKSWRVRLCLSKNLTQIAQNFGREVTDMSLIQTLGNLLKDSEIDVKIEAVKSLRNFLKIMSPDRMGVLVPQILALGKDSLGIVRASIGSAIKTMLPALSKDQAYQNILPLIKQLMKDENQEVRKGGIQSCVKFIEVLGPQTISSLSGSLKACLQDPKWRVRLELLKYICELAVNIHNYDFFVKHIEPIYLSYLRDRASAIRNVGISMIIPFAKCFGDSWVSTFMVKLQETITKQTSYHFKIAALYSMKEVCLSPLSDHYMDRCLALMFKACSDNVPNVREVATKSLRDIAFTTSKLAVKENIRKHIALMANDHDQEVKMTVGQILARF